MSKRKWFGRVHWLAVIVLLFLAYGAQGKSGPVGSSCDDRAKMVSEFREMIETSYEKIGLSGKLQPQVFELAMTGYYNMRKRDLLTLLNPIAIVDYNQPSTAERLFLIDVESQKLMMQSLVAHGKNTGNNFARNFSNKPGSLASSLGFLVTGRTYFGKHGYSLKLKGVEPGFNHNAEKRYLVIHGADYVSEAFIKKYGRLGRSWGCPALPVPLVKSFIDEVKQGTCFFIYFNESDYLQNSTYLDIESAARQWQAEREIHSES